MRWELERRPLSGTFEANRLQVPMRVADGMMKHESREAMTGSLAYVTKWTVDKGIVRGNGGIRQNAQGMC
jgi:hypothetical protein